jgi:hypothetical protein
VIEMCRIVIDLLLCIQVNIMVCKLTAATGFYGFQFLQVTTASSQIPSDLSFIIIQQNLVNPYSCYSILNEHTGH